MSTTIVNGAPMTVFYGTDDQSTRLPIREPEMRPTHLPLFYIYAKKGREDIQFLVGGSRDVIYGAETFDETGKYCTHQTIGSNIVNAQGNLCAYKRVRPDDANPPATLRLWLDVLKTDVPEYERHEDGSYKINEFGEKVESGNTVEDGYILKWVVTEATNGVGSGTMEDGDQISDDGSEVSKRYPIMDFEVDSFGAYGNNLGVSLWAPTTRSSDPIDSRLVTELGVYPYRVALIERKSSKHNGSIQETISGEPYLNVSLKQETRNPFTLREMFIGDVIIDSYSDVDTPGLPPVHAPFGTVSIYNDYIETILQDLYESEIRFQDEFSDFTDDGENEHHLINFVSGQTSQGTPYTSIVMNNEEANSVTLTDTSTVYARGGSDGTMDEELLADLVARDLENFADRNHDYQNSARYPVSHLYDTGWPLDTKYAMANFIALRKDTIVVCSTYDVNGGELTAADESSLGQALKTRFQMVPESEYFGTSTMRAMVVPRYGRLLNTKYRKKLPLTLEIADKSAKFMGAGNRVWDINSTPEGDPNNKVSLFVDINNTFTPTTVRNSDWDNGIVGVLDFDRSQAFFPAYKTVYDNDTSVLNSYITACAIAELQKVGEIVWRELSGVTLPESVLIKEVNERYRDKVTNVFAGRYVITPNAYFTAEDRARGYSWTTDVTIYAPNQYTVQRLIIRARRMSDLEEG